MDHSFLLVLSNLLHLHNHLDPTTSSLLSSDSSSSSTSLLTSASAAPLLFFTIASVLSYLSLSSRPSPPPSSPPPNPEFSVAAFRALTTDHIWSLSAPTRDAHWRSSYGLSYPVFTTVVDKLKPYIAQSNLSLPSDYAVAMVLSRLAHGHSSQTLASSYSLEPYLISKITNMVTRLLATKLYPEFIKIPVSRSRLIEITQAFQTLTSLPNVCGVIAGTEVKLHRLPSNQNRSAFLRPHTGGHPALLLQVVADHKKIFWDVCVKAPGGSNSAAHLRDSLLYQRLTSGDVVWDKVMTVKGHHVRPYVIGDSDLPLLSFLLTPFGRPSTSAQREFNSALLKGKRVVEDAIGLLKGRWKILQDLNVGLNHAPQTIVACCVLHNLCQIAREPEPELWREAGVSDEMAMLIDSEQQSRLYGESMRQALADDLYQRVSR